MPKKQPADTTSHTLFLPNELDRKIKSLTKYGTADDFIIQCIEEGIVPHWREWIAREYAKVNEGATGENGQGTVRRSPPPDVAKPTEENVRDKGRKEGRRNKT
ncbi:MAG TPA: hypothetical protein VKA07_13610 [Candidatus Sulfotelmatobacter sp.]|nr:hypothetical protein [Candidatus Sulfotelmatobacter sp.]